MKHGWTRYIYQLWFNFLHKITWTSQRIPRQLNDTHPKIHLEFLCPKRTCPLLCQFLNFLPISYLIDILHPESPASWYKLNWTKALRSTDDESNTTSEPQILNLKAASFSLLMKYVLCHVREKIKKPRAHELQLLYCSNTFHQLQTSSNKQE